MGREEGHLAVLRTLLLSDALATASWNDLLQQISAQVREHMDARASFIAWRDTEEGWRAIGSDGRLYRNKRSISREIGSVSALDHVRETGESVLNELPGSPSNSALAHGISTWLVVPIRLWQPASAGGATQVVGCLYADRATGNFSADDLLLARMIVGWAQPALYQLRQIEVVRDRAERLTKLVEHEYSLGSYSTRDQNFAEEVILPLKRYSVSPRAVILLVGPTGAGKTHLARAYHEVSPRAGKVFEVFDCAAVADKTAIAAELFGYAPNSAFAGADPKGKRGKAVLADGGTLFIDEIGEFSLEHQTKLLSLLDKGRITPLGGNQSQTVDVQVIAATNRNLPEMVERGQFRRDLFSRLDDGVVFFPPLSERTQDIPMLVEHFLSVCREILPHTAVQQLSEAALHRVITHDWATDGNVRGLETLIRRSVLCAPPGTCVLEEEHLRFGSVSGGRWKKITDTLLDASEGPAGRNAAGLVAPGDVRARILADAELREIAETIRLHKTGKDAARALEMTYDALIRALRKHGLGVREVLLAAGSEGF